MKKTTLLGTVRGITVLQSSTNIEICQSLAASRNVTETKISLGETICRTQSGHPAVRCKERPSARSVPLTECQRRGTATAVVVQSR
jgi:hypothetical protein